MATWTKVPKASDFAGMPFGYGLFGGGLNWTAVTQNSTTWTVDLRNDMAGFGTAGQESAGGTAWTEESKDS